MAFVTARFVVVALVEVEDRAVKFWRVVEAVTSRPLKRLEPAKALSFVRSVLEAAVIVIAWEPSKATLLMSRLFCKVVAV